MFIPRVSFENVRTADRMVCCVYPSLYYMGLVTSTRWAAQQFLLASLPWPFSCSDEGTGAQPVPRPAVEEFYKIGMVKFRRPGKLAQNSPIDAMQRPTLRQQTPPGSRDLILPARQLPFLHLRPLTIDFLTGRFKCKSKNNDSLGP